MLRRTCRGKLTQRNTKRHYGGNCRKQRLSSPRQRYDKLVQNICDRMLVLPSPLCSANCN
jgi:hypothetical protein